MAKTVIHLPPQITSRSKEKKRTKSAPGWSRERLQHLLSIQVTAITVDEFLTLNSSNWNKISQLNHFQNKGLLATLRANRD